MFAKTIHINKKDEIAMGGTSVPYSRTFNLIMDLLAKHKCDRIGTLQDRGEKEPITKIAFELQDQQYVIEIPRVYVKAIYHDKIGIRLIYWFLKSHLELFKARAIDFKFLMLSTRTVETPQGTMTFGEAVEELASGNFLDVMKIQKAIEGKDDVIGDE